MEGGEDLGGDEGRETMIRIFCMKITLISIKIKFKKIIKVQSKDHNIMRGLTFSSKIFLT